MNRQSVLFKSKFICFLINSNQFELILEVLNEYYGYDFHEYDMDSLRRRINNYIQKKQINDINIFIEDLIHRHSVLNDFLSSIVVSTTELYRDPHFYLSFGSFVVPYLKNYNHLKIWHAGCSTGEEVYSMAILLKEHRLLNQVLLYGTDINPMSVERARKGIILSSNLRDSTKKYFMAKGQNRLHDYWTVDQGYAKLKDDLMNRVSFFEHNLVSDKSFASMDAICARNVLIYFNSALKKKVLNLFYTTLKPKGFLCLGSKESLVGTNLEDKFDIISSKDKIYQKKNEFLKC